MWSRGQVALALAGSMSPSPSLCLPVGRQCWPCGLPSCATSRHRAVPLGLTFLRQLVSAKETYLKQGLGAGFMAPWWLRPELLRGAHVCAGLLVVGSRMGGWEPSVSSARSRDFQSVAFLTSDLVCQRLGRGEHCGQMVELLSLLLENGGLGRTPGGAWLTRGVRARGPPFRSCWRG